MIYVNASLVRIKALRQKLKEQRSHMDALDKHLYVDYLFGNALC